MKHGKRPTMAQKKLMKRWDLDPTEWFVVKDTSKELVVVHRHSDSTFRHITKEK